MNEETNGSEVTKLRAEVESLKKQLDDALHAHAESVDLSDRLNDRLNAEVEARKTAEVRAKVEANRVGVLLAQRRLGEPTPFDHRREVLATTAAKLTEAMRELNTSQPLAMLETQATFRHELSQVANALAELRRDERGAPR